MKDLIQLRKEVAGIIQHGKSKLGRSRARCVVAVRMAAQKAISSKPNNTQERLCLRREQADLISLGKHIG